MTVILVAPEGSSNIGSVCRAMKTMGLSKLIIIPNPNITYNETEIKTMALHAWDIYTQRKEYATLYAALMEYPMSVAFSRRERAGSIEKSTPLPLLHQHLHSTESLALVFGRESSGLSKREIQCCSLQAYIPTNPEYPSLNLAMAVQVVAYELARQHWCVEQGIPNQISSERSYVASSTQSVESAATGAEIEQLLEEPMKALKQLGFFRQQEEQDRRDFFRRILSRSYATKEEVSYFTQFITKIAKIRLYKNP